MINVEFKLGSLVVGHGRYGTIEEVPNVVTLDGREYSTVSQGATYHSPPYEGEDGTTTYTLTVVKFPEGG